MDIFVSVGRTSTTKQEHFVQLIESLLTQNGMTPKTVGRNSFGTGRPLQLITELMKSCGGVVIIAFERTFIEKGIDQRGGAAFDIVNATLPTVWNQVEAGMAHVVGAPIFVLVEEGLKREAILLSDEAWVVSVDLDDSDLSKPAFQGVFAAWKKSVDEYAARIQTVDASRVDPGTLTLRELLMSSRPSQIWAVLTIFIGVLASTATASYYVRGLIDTTINHTQLSTNKQK